MCATFKSCGEPKVIDCVHHSILEEGSTLVVICTCHGGSTCTCTSLQIDINVHTCTCNHLQQDGLGLEHSLSVHAKRW